MEELWKDLTLPSFHSPQHHHSPTLQHFLPRKPPPASAALPFSPPPPPSPSTSPAFPSFPANNNLSGDKDSSGDKRYKRMMKNREAATRSRARRRAYTLQLERERSRLVEENARLRRNLQEHQVSKAEGQAPKKDSLSRSLSAPF